MNVIETPRLLLQLVSIPCLLSTAAADVKTTREIMGTKLHPEWFDDGWVYKLRHDQCIEDPDYIPWSIRAIMLKAKGEIVGNMNCHHMPMEFKLNISTALAVEMGYTIFGPWRRQGIAFEAIQGFAAWAHSQGVKGIVLSISPQNAPSLALARKLGATQIGSQIDEKDGPEDVFYFPCVARPFEG